MVRAFDSRLPFCGVGIARVFGRVAQSVGNLRELSILGAMAGVLLGFSGVLLNTWRQTAFWTWSTSVVALAVWYYIPRW